MQTLDEAFKSKHGITEVVRHSPGAQKDVFIIKKNEESFALKCFRGFGDREKKELAICKKYENLNGIPKIIDIFENNGTVIVLEEFIEGSELENIKINYKNDFSKIKKLILELCSILSPIWNDKIIHRDLKPSNIIITPSETPVILDFGIAKDLSASTITETGFQPNSWQFAAPEQLLAKKEFIGYRTDIFSLGTIAYKLYYGVLPFGNSKEAIVEKFNQKNLQYETNEDCELNTFFKRSLNFYPSNRFNKIDDIINSL